MKRPGMTLAELLVVVAICAILAFIVVGFAGCNNLSKKHTGTYQCVKTYTTMVGENSSKRVDLRPQAGGPVITVVCDDNIFVGVSNSATLYAQFEAGKWYSVTMAGERREGFAATFPYVTSVSPVPAPDK